MLDPLSLLSACEDCYAGACITAGPDGRDGALVRPLPGGGTLLVFRGTICAGVAGILDRLNDLRSELVQHPAYSGKVHKGFADSLDDLWGKLPVLAPPLTITGHSKGGALAVLTASRLVNKASYAPAPKVVTFGAPMPGDYQFSYSCSNVPVTRWINPHDLVPNLPPLAYWYVGMPITPGPSWTPPRGVRENHELATGYRPWVAELVQTA